MTKNYAGLVNELRTISHEALAECPAPTPMVVDDGTRHWYVADGVCGFATVVLESGRTGLAQWLLKNQLGRKWWSYGRTKGVALDTFARHGFADAGQSYEKNKYVANKIAAHLRACGFDAWVDARVD